MRNGADDGKLRSARDSRSEPAQDDTLDDDFGGRLDTAAKGDSELRFLDSVDSWTGESARRLDARETYEGEALALAEQRPERAALMWLESARICHEQDADDSEVLRGIDAALRLRPHTGWLLTQARRLLLGRALHEQAVQLAEREVQAGGESGGRAAVLFEASSVALFRLDRPVDALRLAEQAQRIQPHHIPSLVRVAALREQLAQHADAARALQQLSEYLTDPLQRAQLLHATGTLAEMRLDQDEAAQAAYLRAVESDAACVPALAALCELQERTEQWSALCKSFERLAEISTSKTQKARLWQHAGTLHLDRTGNLETACRDLRAAASAAPDDVSILQRLAHAWEARGQADEAARTLEQVLELTLDRQSRAALRTQIATLRLEQLHDPERAIAALTGALEEAPGYLPALQSLGTLYRQRGDFASLVAMSNPETEGMLPAETRALRYIELADLLHQKLDQPDQAIAAYRRAMDLSPGNLLAFWQLAPLLGRLGRYGELAELLGTQADASGDLRTRSHLLLRRAQIQAGPLADPEAAITTLRRARPDDGARAVALEQIDLHARTGRHARLAELLQVQAAITEDPHEAEGRRLLAARILELELDESEKALDLYREILAENPASAAAIHGAGRILHRLGAWTELVELHFFELEHEPERVDASTLLCRVGRILAEKLGHHAAAVEAYARALERDPTCTPALAALEQLARNREQWSQLVAVLERRAEERGDRGTAALSLCRAAEVAGWQLGSWSDALSLYQKALAIAPEASTARRGLLRALLHERRWAEAAALLEQLTQPSVSAEEQAVARLSLARLREFRLGEPASLAHYRAAEDGIGPDKLQQQLTRVRRLCQSPDLAAWLFDLGQKIGDSPLGSACLIEASHMWELRPETDWGKSAEASRAAHQRVPADLNAIWSLERALRAGGQWDEVGVLREKEAQLELDRGLRAILVTRAAEAFSRAGNAEATTRLCDEGLNADAHCLPALLLLAQLAEQRRDWTRGAEIYDQIASACAAADNRRHYALRAAEIWAGLVRDRPRALTSIGVALADDPSNEEAFSFAVQLLHSDEDLEELSRMYQRAIGACENPSRRVDLLRQNARILAQIGAREGRSGSDRAIGELNTLLAIKADDVDALAELAELQSRQQHWSDAATTLGQLIAHSTDAQVLHTARVQQAELWLEQLHEPDRASEVLELAASERPTDLGIARLRLQVMQTVGDWSAAHELLNEIGQSELRPVRMWAKLQLAEIARLGLNDSALQEHCEWDVVQLAAREPDIVGQLRELGMHRAQTERLVNLAERALQSAPPETASALRQFIAAVATEELDDPVRALPQLRQLLADEPTNPTATLLMARALEAKDEPAAAVRYYRQALDVDAGAPHAYRGLTRTASAAVALSAAAIVDLLGATESAERRSLSDVDWSQLPNGSLSAAPPQPEERFSALQQILEALLPYLNVAYPSLPGLQPAAGHPVVDSVHHLAHAIGLGTIEIRLGETGTARVGIGRPAILQIDPTLADQPPGPEFRFWIGRALGRALAGGAIIQQLDEEELEQLFHALRERKTAASTALELQKTLHRAVPRKVRRHVIQLLPKVRDPKLWERYRHRLERWADRLALVLCRHPGIGLRALARSEGLTPERAAENEELAALMRFVVSDEYARLYRGVWRPVAKRSAGQ